MRLTGNPWSAWDIEKNRESDDYQGLQRVAGTRGVCWLCPDGKTAAVYADDLGEKVVRIDMHTGKVLEPVVLATPGTAISGTPSGDGSCYLARFADGRVRQYRTSFGGKEIGIYRLPSEDRSLPRPGDTRTLAISEDNRFATVLTAKSLYILRLAPLDAAPKGLRSPEATEGIAHGNLRQPAGALRRHPPTTTGGGCSTCISPCSALDGAGGGSGFRRRRPDSGGAARRLPRSGRLRAAWARGLSGPGCGRSSPTACAITSALASTARPPPAAATSCGRSTNWSRPTASEPAMGPRARRACRRVAAAAGARRFRPGDLAGVPPARPRRRAGGHASPRNWACHSTPCSSPRAACSSDCGKSWPVLWSEPPARPSTPRGTVAHNSAHGAN